jgi:hypothetical protein
LRARSRLLQFVEELTRLQAEILKLQVYGLLVVKIVQYVVANAGTLVTGNNY